MPSPSIPIELESPLGLFEFNSFGADTYARVEGFSLSSPVRASVEALAGRDGSIVPDAFRNGATPILKGRVTIGGGEQARDDMIETLVSHAVATLRSDGYLRWLPRGAAVAAFDALPNLCTNGNFETDSSGWVQDADMYAVASTDHAYVGSQSLLVRRVGTGTADAVRYFVTVPEAGDYTFSAYLWIPSSFDGDGIYVKDEGFGLLSIVTDADLSLRDQWQRVVHTWSPGAGDLSGSIAVHADLGSIGADFYLDAVVIEPGTTPSAIPTGKRRLAVRCLEDPQDDREGVTATFQLAFVSRTPYSESDDLFTVTTASLTAASGGTLSFPISFPIAFGDASIGGGATVTNRGDTDTYPAVRIYGPISGPIVRHVESGLSISLPSLTVNEGDFVEIDMSAETILYNGSPDYSLLGSLDPTTSDFFTLPPGDSTVVLSGSNVSANTKAEIDYRHAYARG